MSEQDLNRDPNVAFFVDQYGQRRDAEGKLLPEDKQGPVAYGSASPADLTAPTGVVGQAPEHEQGPQTAQETAQREQGSQTEQAATRRTRKAE